MAGDTAMKRPGSLLAAGACLLALAAFAAAQEEEEPPVVVIEPEEKPPGVEPALIGMEAFHEVLASGDYLVGPGDEFLIFSTGMEEPYMTPVLSEGGLFIPKVGPVRVGGLRLRDAHKAIADAFRQTVKVGSIHVELSKLRQFPVSVVGMVEEPGIRQASGVERVGELIREAGGLSPFASSRNILLVKTGLDAAAAMELGARARQGDTSVLDSLQSRRVDLRLYEATGLSRYNPFIEDGDIVLVPARRGEIAAHEAVHRPDYFEFVEGDRISDLLSLAHGPAASYDPDNALLFRYREDGKTQYTRKIDIEAILQGREDADLALEPEDWIVLRKQTGYHGRSTVLIIGEVKLPGFHVVEENGTSLSEVIRLAGGFTREAALSEARVVRQREQVAQLAEDPEFERIRWIPPADRTEDENQYFIMKSREKPGQMVVDFVALEAGDESQDIELLPGDVINVPRLQQTVTVSGAATSPGAIVYNPDYLVWDYIEAAGGFGWRASDDVRVIKARTGQSKLAKDVRVIDPGDRIWIKEKPERDYWTIFTQSMAVIGEVSTIVLLFVTLTR